MMSLGEVFLVMLSNLVILLDDSFLVMLSDNR